MKKVLLLTFSVFLFSCIEQKTKRQTFWENYIAYIAASIKATDMMQAVANPNAITIDQEKHETVPYTELQNLLKEVKYIPLVSKEPIGIIDKVLIYKDRIFVLDAHKAEKVFIFNMQGEIINVIDRKGGGPEEYAGLTEMHISWNDDCIVLNDRLAPFFLYFSLDGKFIRKGRKIPNSGFVFMGDTIINHMSRGQSIDGSKVEEGLSYHLVATVNDDSIISRGFPFYPIQVRAAAGNPLFYNSIGELLFHPTLSDTVYQILSNSSYMVKYVVKQKKSIWDKYDQRIGRKECNDLIKNSDYTTLSWFPILETERFVYFAITAKKKILDKQFIGFNHYWYDKTKGILFDLGENDYLNMQPIFHEIPYPRAIYGNYFAGIITIEQIEGCRRTLAHPTYDFIYKNEELKAIIKSKNPDLEGILVLYEFK